MNNRKFGRAPDFTAACVVMFGVNITWILLTLYAVYGLVIAVFAALVVNHVLNWVAVRRRATVPAESKKDAIDRK